MNQDIRSLLRRVDIKPNESLPSLLYRLTKQNYYESERIIAELCGLQPNNLSFPEEQAQTKRLVTLTKMPSDQLWATTVHWYAPILVPYMNDLEFISIDDHILPVLPSKLYRRYIRSEGSAQFCSDCLQEDAYHRLNWMPLLSTACTKHKKLLIHRCPNCTAKVNIFSVVETTCGKCGFDLKKSPSIDVTHDVLGLECQGVVHRWLVNRVMTYDSHPAAVIHYFLYGICSCFTSIDDWYYWHSLPGQKPVFDAKKPQLSPATWHIMLTTAFKAVKNWPDGFHEFLFAYSRRNGKKRNGGLHKDFGSLYGTWLGKYWQGLDFLFIQDAFGDFLAQKYFLSSGVKRSRRLIEKPTLSGQFRLLSSADAARELGVSPRIFKSLVKEGMLEVTEQRNSATNSLLYFSKSGILHYGVDWRESLYLDRAAEKLGTSYDMIKALLYKEILTGIRCPNRRGYLIWKIRSESFWALREALMFYTEPWLGPVGNNLLSLTNVAQRLQVVGKNAADIVGLVATGELFAYRPQNDELRIEDLRFRRRDIDEYTRDARIKNGWVMRKEVAKRMGEKYTAVNRWVAIGLLKPIDRRGLYFAKRDVDSFVENYIHTEEAAAIIMLSVLVVQKWARKGRLHPVAGNAYDGSHRYLFHREEIERFRPDNRLTAPKLAHEIGISRTQIIQWISEGKIKPVSGPGIDKCGHYLFLRSEMPEWFAARPDKTSRMSMLPG